MSTKVILSALIVIATFAVYWNVKNNDFIIYDDYAYVKENAHVPNGLTKENFAWAFTTVDVGNWHPLTWLSHMTDCELFGLNPKWHHLANVFFHAAGAVLLFLLLLRMTGARWQSAFVAALFALHPLHVESVAWVAERKDVLSGLLWMLTLLMYVHYSERPCAARYLLALSAFALGLMAKPMLVTLPAVMLLLDYWPLRRTSFPGADGAGQTRPRPGTTGEKISNMRLVLEKVPFFVLAGISSVITVYAQRAGGSVSSIDIVPLTYRAENAAISYLKYIEKMFWPEKLAIIYPLPLTLAAWQGLSAGLLLLALSICAFLLAKRRPYILVGWFWYIITLLPVIGLVQVGKQAMADRYTYIPFIGIFIIIAWGAPGLLFFIKGRYRKTVLAALAGSVLLACSAVTWAQLGYWKDSLTLFGHAIDVVENNYVAKDLLGEALLKKGRLDEAAENYSAVLRILPGDEDARKGMGTILFFDPANYTAHMGLGDALFKQGRLDEAVGQYMEAVKSRPESGEAQYSLALALGQSGRIKEAIPHFEAALRINPGSAEAHYNLGVSLVREGRLDEAIGHFEESLRIRPDLEQARSSLQAAQRLKAGL